MDDGMATGSGHKDRVRDQFGKTARDYVSSPNHRQGQDIERLVELTEATPDDDALDIATGGGHTALAVAPHVRSMVSSDLTPDMLAAAEEHITSSGATNVSFELADAENLPFPDGSFDIVTCRIAPHHFDNPQSFASEVSRVLRPGGRFVLMDSLAPDDDELDMFINEFEWRRDQTHVRSYRFAEWENFIQNAGMEIEEHEVVIRTHDYEQWTARSRMTEQDRADLDAFVHAQSDATRDYFGFDVQDGQIKSFIDHKVLLRARKSV